MNRIGYVVLHYQMLEETIACVESIKKKHGNGKVSIVVVDNGSPNKSGDVLRNKYLNDSEITVILSDDNLGFACGLNLGIAELKKSNTDFFVLLNNDTELLSDNWDDTIIKKYEQYKFGVIGPDIVSPDLTRHDNPTLKQDTSIKGLKKMLVDKRIEYLLYLFYIKPFIKKIRKALRNILMKKNEIRHQKKEDIKFDKNRVQLQGSCMILSPEYMKHYDGLYDKTFLYFEEAILRYRCEQAMIPCMYIPNLKLIHKGSISVKQSTKNERKRKLFYLKHSLKSVSSFYNSLLESSWSQNK